MEFKGADVFSYYLASDFMGHLTPQANSLQALQEQQNTVWPFYVSIQPKLEMDRNFQPNGRLTE